MVSKKVWIVGLIAAASMAAGCSAKKNATTITELEGELNKKNQEVVELRSEVDTLENDLKQVKTEVDAKSAAAMKAEQAAREAEARARAAEEAGMHADGDVETAAMTSELLPPNPKTGACYARMFLPPTYGTETERVLSHEASEKVEIIPARYEWTEEQVLVKQASERLEVVPARYETVEEKVLVKQASKRVEEVTATYKWAEEKILVEPAHEVWKKGRGPIEKIDNATGEILCLVEVPARYEIVRKRILDTPAGTREVEIPAEYRTVKKTIMVEAPKTHKVTIPAEYTTVKVKKMVEPPQVKRIPIAAEYETVTRTVQLSDGRLEWREILCETNMNNTTVSKIQRALMNSGHNPGPIDGVYGAMTQSAVESFQKANGLATGALTSATVEKLGINI